MEVLSENTKQSHLQAFARKNGFDSDPPDLSPKNFEWLLNEANW